MTERLTGKCLCGGVSFAVDVESTDVDACHCSICRRWTGGPLMVVEHKGPIEFEGREYIQIYASSEAMDRGFCRVCGSTLFTKLNNQDHYFIAAGLISEGDKLALVEEIFIDDKPPYYAFANETHKMTGAEFFAAWQAGEDKAD